MENLNPILKDIRGVYLEKSQTKLPCVRNFPMKHEAFKFLISLLKLKKKRLSLLKFYSWAFKIFKFEYSKLKGMLLEMIMSLNSFQRDS